MASIPASQDVNVLPSVLPAGGSAIDLNGLLLTTNPRVPIGSVQSFPSALAMANFFGATDPAAVSGGIYFGGFNGSNKKPGAYLVAQYPAAPVSAYLRGGNVSALALATLQGFNATLTVTIDGVVKTAAINLAAATSFANAAAIAAAALAISGPQAASVTASAGATFTGTGSGTNLTVTSVVGVIHPGAGGTGDLVAGTGVPGGTTIVSQTSGTTGGAGVYVTSNPTTSAGAALTTTSTTLDVTALLSGTVGTTQVISGTGVTANTYITGLGTGTGGVGTYVTNTAQQFASTTVTVRQPGVVFDSVSGAFVVNSGTTGAASTITFGSGAMATNLLLTQATGAVLSQGAAAATPAAFMNAVIAQTTNWATFKLGFDPDNGSGFASKLLFSQWANGQNNRYAFVVGDTDVSPTLAVPAPASFGFALNAAGYSGTILIWEPTSLNHASFAQGWAASIDFTQQNGRATLDFKSQTGLVPGVTDGGVAINLGGNPQVLGDRGNGYNFYGSEGSGNAGFVFMKRGFVSGPFKWADSFVNQIWLNNSLQTALMNYLTQVKSVPFNAAGYAAVESALSDAIQAGITFGAYSPGVALSASQIASVNAAAGVDAATPLQQRGWYLQVVPATPTVRASRGPLAVTFWYCDAGSIQSISLNSVALQ